MTARGLLILAAAPVVVAILLAWALRAHGAEAAGIWPPDDFPRAYVDFLDHFGERCKTIRRYDSPTRVFWITAVACR